MSEEEKFAEKYSRFYGTAKIHLKHLVFQSTSELPSQLTLNPKNVERLTQIFRLEGCQRLDLEHHVPAIISKEDLDSSLQLSGIGVEDLRRRASPPTLYLPEAKPLICLHGKHRVAAARNVLLPGNKWWTVDLFSDDLDNRVVVDIRDEYANSRNFCDGEIFQQIRQAQIEHNPEAESKWLARLSEGKRKDLKQLQRRSELKPLASALDKLLPYIGFWPSLQIGTFHRVLNLKCPEVSHFHFRDAVVLMTEQELEHYLEHIRTCWDKILSDRDSLKAQVDFGTIRRLQTRHPRTCHDDAQYVTHMMETNQLFPMVADTTLRSHLLERILEIPHMIPSLHTFFEDTKWLEPCAKVMRSLLPPGSRGNTRTSFLRVYNNVSEACCIQRSPTKFIRMAGSEAENAERSYIQLWMFAWRYFPELSGIMPRRDAGFPKPQAKTSNLHCLYRFAETAAKLGFDSVRISDLLNRDPDIDMAHQFLKEARPKEFFEWTVSTRDSAARRIRDVLKEEWECSSQSAQVTPTWDISTDHRCGRPHEQSHNDSKARFFYEEIYVSRIQDFSYFSVNRDIFLAFFGALDNRAHSDQDHEMADDSPVANDMVEDFGDMDHDQGIPVVSQSETAVAPIASSNFDTIMTTPQDGAATHNTSNSVEGDPNASFDMINPPTSQDALPMVADGISISNPQTSLDIVHRQLPSVTDTENNALVPVGITQSEVRAASPAPVSPGAATIFPGTAIHDESMSSRHDGTMSVHDSGRSAAHARSLYEVWNHECSNGDVLLINLEDLDYQTRTASQDEVQKFLGNFRDRFWYWVWNPNHGDMRYVSHNTIHNFAKGKTNCDGVVILQPKSINQMPKIRAGSTESRLAALESWHETLSIEL
ncbi:hypothetical protein ACLMJK_004868 [Lecanora helva]